MKKTLTNLFSYICALKIGSFSRSGQSFSAVTVGPSFLTFNFLFNSFPMNIYVGNLPFQLHEDELTALFSPYGEVGSVKIMTDRETGRSRGFGFVEMPNDDEAQQAIEGLHESELKQRTLVVNEAKPRTNDGDRRGGGRPMQRRSGGYSNRY